MTDREQVIATLTEHLDHCKEQDEDEKIINALTYAIESIKVDLTYDLEYEKVDFIEIPNNATNGDMIKAMFPNLECVGEREDTKSYILEPDDLLSPKLIAFNSWWNAPYKAESGE